MSFETEVIQALVKRRDSAKLMVERRAWNVDGARQPATKDDFWLELVMSLLSSQQRSTEGSPTEIFRLREPFPLQLEMYARLRDEEVDQELQHFRFHKRITKQLRSNYESLFGQRDNWSLIDARLQALLSQRNTPPDSSHQELERAVCREFATGELKLEGIGPKQARNLLQACGLTRYEIPLDSRVVGWLQGKLEWNIGIPALNDPRTYDDLLDHVQSLCIAAGVLPAIFDAAAFEDYVKPPERPTTCVGYVNRNGQVVIRNTRQPGTDKNQYVYQLGCSHCGNVYGANGSDIHLCPGCQAGAKGLTIE